jgi:hypothetical protein
MSAMLGSSRREARMLRRLEGDQILLVERQIGTIRFWTARLVERLESLFSPPSVRP